jgi:hypothetical protein
MYGVKVWRQQTTAKISAKYKAAHSEEKGGEMKVYDSTCHHTDSTIRENIQASTFSNATINVSEFSFSCS